MELEVFQLLAQYHFREIVKKADTFVCFIKYFRHSIEIMTEKFV